MANGKMRVIAALAAALLSGSAQAGAEQAHSSAADRQHFLEVTRSLEQDPLTPDARADRTWALSWLIDAPDVTVQACPATLGGLLDSKYAYAGEILLQDTFAMAALLIQHPEAANDPVAQQMAGVEGALAAYRSILRDKPAAKAPALESLLQMQSHGTLRAFVDKAWTGCSAKK